MGCGYACAKCGMCEGRAASKLDPLKCPKCKHANPEGSDRCEKCSFVLPKPPGVRAANANLGAPDFKMDQV